MRKTHKKLKIKAASGEGRRAARMGDFTVHPLVPFEF